MAYVRTRYRVRGFGDAVSTAQTVGTASNVGIGAGTAVAGALTSATGPLAGATILGMSASAAIPIIGAALVGVTLLAEHLIANSGCGPTCIQATQYANQAGQLMDQNLHAYLALPTPRSQTAQAAALANFDALWAKLMQMCSDPSLGNAGKRCISDRQQGSCAYHVAEGGGWQQQNGKWVFVPYGPNGSGPACYNSFIGGRDPIANDPYVVPDAQAAAPSSSPLAALTSGGSNTGLLLLLAGAAIVAVMVL